MSKRHKYVPEVTLDDICLLMEKHGKSYYEIVALVESGKLKVEKEEPVIDEKYEKHKERMREYYKNNREKIRAKQNAWSQEHREEVNERMRQRRKKERENK